MQNQKGFTLIELMIVIAIIAILAAIALPAYNNYVAKSQVTEAVSLASSFKTPTALSMAEDGTCPNITKTASGTDNLGQYVKALSITAGSTGGGGMGETATGTCVITATMGTDGVSKKAQGGVITLTSSAIPDAKNNDAIDLDVTKWTCTATGLANSLLPKSCQI